VLRSEYATRRAVLVARLADFARMWREASEEDLFAELAFCLLTPQTGARKCDSAVSQLRETGLLWRGTNGEIARALRHRVRFHNHKAEYLVEARRTFSDGGRIAVRPVLSPRGTPYLTREWLVRNVSGLGYKEASHFLRNVGLGQDLAILDRHILRNLVACAVMRKLPTALTPWKYLEIEASVREFSAEVGIPMGELDLLLWSKETGEIFK